MTSNCRESDGKTSRESQNYGDGDEEDDGEEEELERPRVCQLDGFYYKMESNLGSGE